MPLLMPLFQDPPPLPESAYSLFGNEGSYVAIVQLLVMVSPEGAVAGAEVLSGFDALRKPALDSVRQYKFRPVLRRGQPVCAYTTTIVHFRAPGKPLAQQDPAETRQAMARQSALAAQWPRTPEQVLADAEQDFDPSRGLVHTLELPRLGKMALAANSLEKAAAYANESLTSGRADGQSIFDSNMILGVIALREGNLAEAKQRLIASGKTPGSPSLMTFGPNMTLARDLLQKGERDTVLEFFTLCDAFWKSGSQKLASWAETVRNGGVPNFGANLAY